MGTIVGIDLGTTFSAVARLDETGRPVIVHNADGSNITPSVVLLNGNSTTVGEDPRKLLGIEENAIGRFKREMGTDKEYRRGDVIHTPITLSALVLKKLKQDTEAQLGPIDEAVVTIPANFANEAREATLAAANAAGLKIKYIINEPTAAALYYSQYSGGSLSGTFAIYDLGGGTFDISIVQVKGNDIEVLSTEGVNKLGGDDFDNKLQEIIRRKYRESTSSELALDEFTKNDAEEEKKSLSRQDKVTVRASGRGGRANIVVTRTEYEESISSLLAQAEMLCEAALEDASKSPSDIEAVILVGGSTRTPAVKQSVKRVFKQEPTIFANPDEVVALGAALYAAYKTDSSNLNTVQSKVVKKIKLEEITSKHFGTFALLFNQARSDEELQNTIIIKKGARIPASVTESFYTRNDGQTAVDCSVTESNTPETDPRFVRVIFSGTLELPAGRPRGQEIRITYSYDQNQTMHCSFLDVASGKQSDVNLNLTEKNSGSKFDINRFIVD